jgi:hypothetical protein
MMYSYTEEAGDVVKIKKERISSDIEYFQLLLSTAPYSYYVY